MSQDKQQADDSSVAAWEEFCQQLLRAGRHVLAEETPKNGLDRAEGFRYLARVMRSSLETFVEFNDPDFPVIYRPCDEIIKYGGDNPDNCYQKCALSSEREYRLRGQRNTVHYLGFLTQGSNYAEDKTMKATGFLDSTRMEVAADGSFELIISKKKHPGNWLPMEDSTQALLIRQTFAVREQEQLAELEIECLDSGPAPRPLEEEEFVRNLRTAGKFFDATVELFCEWASRYQAHPNQLPAEDQEMCQRVGGDPNIRYYNSFWKLEEDEALLVEVPRIPECENWNLQICNYWMESLDYRYHRIHTNKYLAQYEKDGSVRMVLAHRDPGLPNWLSTAGHHCGLIVFRWIGAREDYVDPVTRVVPLAELQAAS